MAVKIRLARKGRIRVPFYRVVVADARAPRDGKCLETIGTYNPLAKKDSGDRVKINAERIKHWMQNGAQPTDRVRRLMKSLGL